jgi:superoxide reductase
VRARSTLAAALARSFAQWYTGRTLIRAAPCATHARFLEDPVANPKLSRRAAIKYNGLVAISVAVPAWLIEREGLAAPQKAEAAPQKAGAAPPKNAAWEARAKELEGKGPPYTGAAPGKWKGKEGGHVPAASFEPGQVTIVTKHPMTAEHYITTHYIKDQHGVVIGLKEFTGTDPEAKSTFPLPKGTTGLTVWSHCNLHDLWRAEAKA